MCPYTRNIYIYIARSSSFGKFSETFGMTSEARMRNTDFSISRILSDDRGCSPKTRADRERRSVERDESPARKPRVRFPDLSRAHEEREVSRREEETRREECADRVVPGEITDAFVVEATQRETRRTDLTWLQYTRYRPPKLPRRSYVERRTKRRTDDRPRIPFSSSQLQVLEDRYRRSAYLSRNDVVEMSAMLRLPQSKIKIWFQNRRARQRRESLNSTIVAR
ncbi:homeobox protein MSX-1 [Cataglyphis hispanica]|uniref:homeobox protein MSX-1 n=1 Tax=Cataglyphis hispanica TaxID=1086592 RepID=UPI00217FF8D3|nr:homeobox protein MSX-1 [Cataglyphis hispanica]